MKLGGALFVLSSAKQEDAIGMSEQIKKLFWIAFAVVFVSVFAVWMILNPSPEHIEDTNGPDNYSLEVITEENIAKQDMGTRGSLVTTETHWDVAGFDVSDGVEYSCSKFTGVYRLYSCTVFRGSDIWVHLVNFKVRGGNFAFYVLLDGEIVGEVKPDEFGTAELIINNIEKTASLEYVIAGESADFEFTAPMDW